MPNVFHVKLANDGRVVIPASLRHHLGLKPGDPLVIDAEGDAVRVRSAASVLAEVQAYFQRYVPPGVSMVDELIAERRAEAAREEAEDADWRNDHKRGPGA
jgi:AbrB family looped-hinge helix DNA binding protein